MQLSQYSDIAIEVGQNVLSYRTSVGLCLHGHRSTVPGAKAAGVET
jgi:hypothetical protein